MITAKQAIKNWAMGIAIAAAFFCAIGLTHAGDEEQITAEHKAETIKAAKLKARHEKKAKEAERRLAAEDFNRMMHPLAQVKIK